MSFGLRISSCRSLIFRGALLTLVGATAGSIVPAFAQGGMSMPGDGKPMPSPAATASVTLGGQTLTIKYNQPSRRGRVIMGGLVPYGQVWRTGANPATTLITPVSLHIGNLLVPAGEYTIYTLPSATKWMLIINKQTGQWGTEYHAEQDLGRVEMKGTVLPGSQEVMSISFEKIKGDSAEMHVRWENADEAVKFSTP